MMIEMASHRTLYVNLFSAPGSGKSTVAAAVYSRLKTAGVSVELVREFAKEALWREDYATFNNQVFMTAVQYERQLVLDGKVGVVITDSPILLGLVYPSKRGCNRFWRQSVIEQYAEFRNLNFYLVRNHDYIHEGRAQDEERAIKKDIELRALIDSLGVDYGDLIVGPGTVEQIVSAVLLAGPGCK